MRSFRYLENVTTLHLEQSRCIGCGRCVEVCPHQVFAAGSPVVVIDLDACMECGACSMNCPVGAIRVDAGVGCASGLINEWLRQRKIPGFDGGGCCS